MLFADGFEQAIIGYGVQFNRTVVVYDYPECLAILIDRDDMTLDDAIEFMEFNVIGAWVGDETPVFMHQGDYESVREKAEEEGE